MIQPDSESEWELEQETFAAANDTELPDATRDLIKTLWEEVVTRERNLITRDNFIVSRGLWLDFVDHLPR